MNRRGVWASLTVPALAAIVYAACSGVSSQEPSATRDAGEAATAVRAPELVQGVPFVVPEVLPRPEAEVVYIGPIDVPAVALTIDTGVQAGYVPEMLDIVKERGVAVTFGITGEWAVTNPELLKRIADEGHAVINHSWTHRSFTGEDTETAPLTDREIRKELQRTEDKIRQITQVSTQPYFRPPYGDYDKRVNRVLAQEGYGYNVLWTLDSLGWDGRSVKTIVSVVLNNAFDGSIFLLHTDNDRDYAALEGIIDGLEERGLKMVTIPQLLGREPLPTPTPTPTATATPTPTPTPGSESAPAPALPPASRPPPPAATPTPAPGPSPTATPEPSPTATATPDPTATPTPPGEPPPTVGP